MTNDKIKVVIVDDEFLERNLLKNCINWDNLNMEIVGDASDANEAIELIERYCPDIIFTDIQMPIIDGIKLSEMALKKHPQIKIVILTGFDDFEYAQKSIKLGISDYLVKPINDDEVLKTVTNLKMVIEQERKNSEDYSELRRQLYDNLPYLKERFFSELLKGVTDNKIVRERMAFLAVNFKYDSYQIAAMEINHLENKKLNEEARQLSYIKITNIVNAYFKYDKYVIVFLDTMNRIVILNNDENIDLYEKCELLKEEIIKETDCSICIGLGNIKSDLKGVSNSYKEALYAVNYRITVGNNMIILYNQIHFSGKENTYNINDLYSKLGFYHKAGLRDKVSEIIEKFYENIDLEDKTIIKSIRIMAINVNMIFLRNLVDLGLDSEDVYVFEVESYNEIFSLDTIPDIKKYLNNVADKTIQAIKHQQVNKISTLIEDVKKYVNENLSSSDLSLTSLSKIFFLNPSYLSRTFKKEIGMNLIEYLTKIRMEKAIVLLKEKEMKSFEIANAVGIADSNYFSSCFKKYTNISVSDFRKSMKI